MARASSMRAQNEGQRRAQLVAHIAEERGLGAIQLSQALGALTSLLRTPGRW